MAVYSVEGKLGTGKTDFTTAKNVAREIMEQSAK